MNTPMNTCELKPVVNALAEVRHELRALAAVVAVTTEAIRDLYDILNERLPKPFKF